MPKSVNRNKRTQKGSPEGWEQIQPTMDDFTNKMRDAENESTSDKRKVQTVWSVMRVNHQRSRYIYEMFYKRKLISRQLFNHCVKNKLVDGKLIAKWRKQGFEKLCCLRCIQAADTNHHTACICRVPKDKLEENRIVECVHCGCRGCASSD